MAHTLTWDTTYISRVNVNGVSVSQPYTLQDGDTIEVYYLSPIPFGISWVVLDSPEGNYLGSTFDGSTWSLSNTNLYIQGVSAGGGSN